jgi:methionyl-tRNA formyltransferase
VLDISADGLRVATRDGHLEIQRVRPAGGGKITAAAFASSAGLRQGDLLH